jgi:L-threonylcarbamoyladenylate synthase
MTMKLVKANGQPGAPDGYTELIQILDDDGIICFPTENAYRLGASAVSERAVNALMAVKRRSAHAPALIFVSDADALDTVAADVSDTARLLARTFWPRPLTLLVSPGEVFPPKVRKTLSKATGLIGVRIPSHPVARAIVQQFGKPLLVSSANLAKRSGASSPAQVRKNFARQVEAMVDLGDLPSTTPSTLVDVSGDGLHIQRQGAVSEEEIRRIAEVR